MALQPGQTIGRYQIIEPLGTGGMATVYKAYQPSLEREVALKVLRPGFAEDPEFLQRFQREARSIAKLRHPHIVQVFDFEPLDGRYVLAMEFLEGGTLKDRIGALADEGKRLPPAEVARIISEVADALGHGHELGIVHRDMKPSNVMLSRRDRAVVTDFGIAKIVGGEGQTQTGVGIGTPEYMAPEQGAGGKVDERADIYSLGVMAYELLTGRVPFVADTPLAVVLAHVRDPLPLPSSIEPSISADTERVLMKALAKSPGDRYASATEFADALKAAIAPTPATAATTYPITAPATTATAPSAPRVSRRALLAIVAVLLLLVAGAAAFALTRGAGTPATVVGSTEPSIPHGALLYELDKTPAGATKVSLSGQGGKPLAPATVSFTGDAVKLDAPIGSQVNVNLLVGGLEDYVAQIRTVLLGGSGRFLIGVRSTPALSTQAFVETNGNVGIQRFVTGGQVEPIVPISRRLPALAKGTEVEFVVSARGGSIALYVDGVEVARGEEPSRVGSFYMIMSPFSNETISMKLTSLRLFAPTGPATGAPSGAPVTGNLSFAAMRGSQIFASTFSDQSTPDVSGQQNNPNVMIGGGVMQLTPPVGVQPFNLQLSSQPGTQYAMDMNLAFAAQSTMRFALCLRTSSGAASYCLTLLESPTFESMELRYQDGRGGQQVIGTNVQLQGTRNRTFLLAVVVDNSKFTVFIDDRVVLQTSDGQLTTSSGGPRFEASRLGSDPDKTGTVSIRQVHIYKLAGQ